MFTGPGVDNPLEVAAASLFLLPKTKSLPPAPYAGRTTSPCRSLPLAVHRGHTSFRDRKTNIAEGDDGSILRLGSRERMLANWNYLLYHKIRPRASPTHSARILVVLRKETKELSQLMFPSIRGESGITFAARYCSKCISPRNTWNAIHESPATSCQAPKLFHYRGGGVYIHCVNSCLQ